jgi:prephenate dehydrogenase
MSPPATAVVIGTGLIGTSIALALRAKGTTVWLSDADHAAERLAADLGAGVILPAVLAQGDTLLAGGHPRTPDGLEPPRRKPSEPPVADIAVIAVPPAAVAPVLADAQRRGLAGCYTDVASVKEFPLRGAREIGCDLTTFAGGHPMSGRERSGPAAARADLFAGRPWVICPAEETSARCVATVTHLALACGARPVRMPADQHDQWVALVSHAPHLLAAVMAAQCGAAPPGALVLAGPGLRDVTRIAAGDAALWTDILTANAVPVRDVLLAIADRLGYAAQVLTDVGVSAVIGASTDRSAKRLTAMLEAGREGVAAIPGKRGGPAPSYAVVQAVISDQPGELARVFTAAGAAGINIEDVRIEHSPGLPVGVAELSVRPEAAARLSAALTAAGWPVASPP